MPLTYGLFLPQGFLPVLAGIKEPVEAYETLTRVAQTAEECGFASIWLVDHFHPAIAPSPEPLFECWTSTASLARDTKRVRIGQMVTANSFRHPALLAKMASTVDVLSHGRLTFGIGAGGFEPEYRAYGYDYLPASERLHQLREAVQVMLAMWTQEEAAFEGHYYQVRGALNQPKGVQHPHIPLLIGGDGEQVTLKLVAQYGDACNVSGDLATIERKFAVLKRHCEVARRDYHSIHRTAWTMCSIGDTDEQARALLSERMKALFPEDALSSALIGSPETIRQRLRVSLTAFNGRVGQDMPFLEISSTSFHVLPLLLSVKSVRIARSFKKLLWQRKGQGYPKVQASLAPLACGVTTGARAYGPR